MGVFQNSLMGGAASISGDETYTLWSWGTHNNGSSGLGNNTAYSSPVQVGSLNDWTPMICHGNSTVHAIKSDGTLWGWGSGSLLGDGSNTNKSSPIQIGSATDWYYVGTANGGQNNLAINTSGELWVWGDNNQGMLGDGSKTETKSMIQIAGTTWAGVTFGGDFAIGVRTDGTLWGWGYGAQGRTFHDTTTDYSSPVQAGSDTSWWGSSDYPPSGGWESGVEVAKVMGQHGGSWHTNLIDTDGKLWGAGWNALGNIGVADHDDSPRQVGSSTNWTDVKNAGYGGVGVDNGVFKAWGGYNNSGENGNGTKSSTAGTLYEWDTGTALNGAKATDSGAYTYNTANFSGTLYFAGENSHGQFGDGGSTNRSSPVQGPGTTDWTRCIAGDYSTMGVKPG